MIDVSTLLLSWRMQKSMAILAHVAASGQHCHSSSTQRRLFQYSKFILQVFLQNKFHMKGTGVLNCYHLFLIPGLWPRTMVLKTKLTLYCLFYLVLVFYSKVGSKIGEMHCIPVTWCRWSSERCRCCSSRSGCVDLRCHLQRLAHQVARGTRLPLSLPPGEHCNIVILKSNLKCNH